MLARGGLSKLVSSSAILRLAFLGVILAALVLANTEILNIPDHPLCTLTHTSAQASSHGWPILVPDGKDHLFSFQLQDIKTADQDSTAYWFQLQLPKHQSGRLERGWTIRASWPANHPISLSLSIHTPEEMLARGQLQRSKGSKEEESKKVRCSSLFLQIHPTVEGVRIPGPISSDLRSHSPRLLRTLGALSALYLDPLSPLTEESDTKRREVPIHLCLEPLLFGVAPKGITLRLLGVLFALLLGTLTILKRGGVKKVEGWLGKIMEMEGEELNLSSR